MKDLRNPAMHWVLQVSKLACNLFFQLKLFCAVQVKAYRQKMWHGFTNRKVLHGGLPSEQK